MYVLQDESLCYMENNQHVRRNRIEERSQQPATVEVRIRTSVTLPTRWGVYWCIPDLGTYETELSTNRQYLAYCYTTRWIVLKVRVFCCFGGQITNCQTNRGEHCILGNGWINLPILGWRSSSEEGEGVTLQGMPEGQANAPAESMQIP